MTKFVIFLHFYVYLLQKHKNIKKKKKKCKVEFIQPSCWLYSVSNLFVFQHLVTLYLGAIVVRIVSEIECWNAQECARKQRLATGSRGWLAASSRQKQHTYQACQKLKRHASWNTTGQNRTTGCSVISRLDLATQSSCEPALFWKT